MGESIEDLRVFEKISYELCENQVLFPVSKENTYER